MVMSARPSGAVLRRRRAGLRQLRPGGAARCRCRRHDRHEAGNQTTNNTYWAFAPGNETASGQSVGHLWNYGLNTWGWEDTRNGGDRDFNDLIVQFDFTSTYGNGWLA